MSVEPLFSDHWHRVRHLRPRLAADVLTRQHVYRGVPSYVLHRPSTCKYQRLSAATHALLLRFDGDATVDEVWKRTIREPGDDIPTQPDMLDLLARLHEADLLVVDARLDAENLFARGERQDRREWRQRHLNPLNIRIALFDPDRLASAMHRRTGGLSGRALSGAFVAVLLWAAVVAAPRWSTLQHELATIDFLSPVYIGLFLVVYPAMKALHELSHALMLKRFGGTVREAGIALLVLLPVPYVDCSAAALLPDKRERMLVSAAGMMCELLLAALATLLWSVTQGPVHAVALMVMVIGTVSTLLFNGNPLLRFDGYYLLADALEIPNLSTRSRQALHELGRSLFSSDEPAVRTVVADRAERRWLIGYALVAGPFRIALMLGIALMLSERYFFFGMALAIWVATVQLAVPGWRILGFFASTIRGGGPRAPLAGATLLAVAVTAGAAVPVPRHTVVDGVVWLPERVQLPAPGNCEVTEVFASPGAQVSVDTPLLRCHDETLSAAIGLERSRRAELRAERAGIVSSDPVLARVLAGRLAEIDGRIEELERRRDGELVTAMAEGRFVTVSGGTVQGQYFRQGELIGFVVPDTGRTARAVIRQAHVAAFDVPPRSVELQLAEDEIPRDTYDSAIVRRVPEATRRVISAALTSAGGGRLALSARDDGTLVDEPVFDVELRWPEGAPAAGVGSRLRVRFEHEPEPLLRRAATALRRVMPAWSS